MELKTFTATDLQGNVIPNPTAYLYQRGTTTLASGLENETGGALSNPFTGNVNGRISLAAPDGDYDLRVTGGGRDSTMRVRFIDSTINSVQLLRDDLATDGPGKGADQIAVSGGSGGTAFTTVKGFITRIISSVGAALVGFIQAGVDAVVRTVQEKLRERISPEDFGAVGNGVADDTAAMVAAMNEAVARAATLMLRPGATYNLGTWTTYGPAGVLRIDGRSASGVGGVATLVGPSIRVNFLSPSANCDIRGVAFSTWASVVSRTIGQSGSITRFDFVGNRCTACTAPVINIERPIANYRIEDNEFESCTGGYGVRIGENTFANQDTWQDGWITDNRFRQLSAAGTVSAVAVLVYGRRVTIANNKIDGVSQSGTGECWGIYTKARYSHVYGNFVNNVVAAGSSDNVGINIKGTTRPVTASPQGFASVVFGNHVTNIGAAGVRGIGIRAQTDDVIVFGNQVEEPGTGGLVSDESAAYRNVLFQGNFVRWGSAVAGTIGITLEGAGTGVTADNNTVTNANAGVVARTGPTSSTMQDCSVTRNRFFGCTFNVVFDAFAGCTLDRLTLEGNVVDGGTFGLLHNGSAGTVSNMRVRFNDLARAATPAAGAPLTTAIADGNIGWLAGSATWDPPSIANGASASTTLAVGGAAVGDSVRCSFSQPLAGLVLAGQVSAANAVEVRLINNSGGAVDLASGTVKVRVVKD